MKRQSRRQSDIAAASTRGGRGLCQLRLGSRAAVEARFEAQACVAATPRCIQRVASCAIEQLALTQAKEILGAARTSWPRALLTNATERQASDSSGEAPVLLRPVPIP